MIPIVVFLIISAILVSILNAYSIIIVIYCKRLHKTSHIAILSLLVGHLIQGIFVLPVYAYERSDIPKSKAVCAMFRFTYLFSNYICCLSVLVVSLDRFLAVKFPLKYKTKLTSKLMTRILVFLWLYVFLMCLFPFIPSQGSEQKCSYTPQKEWVLIMLLGHTMIPFFVIIICYVFMYKKIVSVLQRRDPKSSHCSLPESERTTETRKRVMSVREQLNKTNVTFFIVIAFFVCRGPSFIYYLLLTICKNECFHSHYYKMFSENYDESLEKETTGFFIKYLTLLDGFLSPLIYCTCNRSFNAERRNLLLHIRRKIFGKEEVVRYRKRGIAGIAMEEKANAINDGCTLRPGQQDI